MQTIENEKPVITPPAMQNHIGRANRSYFKSQKPVFIF